MKTDFAPVSQNEFQWHFYPSTTVFLVGHRLFPTDIAASQMSDQSTLAVDLQPVGAGKRNGDAFRVGVRLDQEIVLHLPLVAIINKVHSRVHIVVFDFTVSGH